MSTSGTVIITYTISIFDVLCIKNEYSKHIHKNFDSINKIFIKLYFIELE